MRPPPALALSRRSAERMVPLAHDLATRLPRSRQALADGVISDGLAAVYILPTVIGIARQVEDLGLVICLNTIPVGWPAALILACMMPRKPIR